MKRRALSLLLVLSMVLMQAPVIAAAEGGGPQQNQAVDTPSAGVETPPEEEKTTQGEENAKPDVPEENPDAEANGENTGEAPEDTENTEDTPEDVEAPEDGNPADTPEEPGETEPEPAVEKDDLSKLPVMAYIPLDNRPVNVDRVIYEAESAGFTVLMPDEDLYATRLDGQPLNSNGTQYGSPEKLTEWMKEMDSETDYFVISLDQILSGGLVNSRSISEIDKEYEIIAEIVELSLTNHVYIVDTVPRLATCTLDYLKANADTYNYLRAYNRKPRASIPASKLTIDAIVAGYGKDEKNKEIPIDAKYVESVKTSFHTRERKLRLFDALLEQDTARRIKYFVGIDDSLPEKTIQTNEIDYIKRAMGSRGLIYSGTDELGMMATLSLMIDFYGYTVNAAAVYFGGTENASSGSDFDIEVVRENVEKHLKSAGVHLVSRDNADLEIVVLTKPEKSILNSKYISQMIDYLNQNIAAGVPTIVINTAPNAYSGHLEYRMIREVEMSMLLAFSSWGTVGNSIGLAMCNGISRYLYLNSRERSSDEADIAFLKGLMFSFEKDISYLRGGGKVLFNEYLTKNEFSTTNFYKDEAQARKVEKDLEDVLKTSEYNVSVNDIIGNMTDSRYFKGLDGECGIIKSIDVNNYSAPFYRSYEIRFDITPVLSDATLHGFKDTMTISMPYAPEDGLLTYAATIYYLDSAGKLHKLPTVYDNKAGEITFKTNKVPYFFTETKDIDAETAYSLFTDVPKGAWYFNDVMYVYQNGLMKGTSEKTFAPSSPMTRAMLLASLFKLAGEPSSNYAEALPVDVADTWYLDAVKWALENGLASGYGNGSFGPDDPVTREQLAVFFQRYAKLAGLPLDSEMYPGLSSYQDAASVTPGLTEGMDWACRSGILTGAGNQLNPKAPATRAEAAVALKRLLELS